MAGKTDRKRSGSLDNTEAVRSMREREVVMKVTKEIVVKFVEMGRVTPASFQEVFSVVHGTVKDAMYDKLS
jgi:hypothetical protein